MDQIRDIVTNLKGKIEALNAEKAEYQRIINNLQSLSDSIDAELEIAEKQLEIVKDIFRDW